MSDNLANVIRPHVGARREWAIHTGAWYGDSASPEAIVAFVCAHENDVCDALALVTEAGERAVLGALGFKPEMPE